MQKKDKKEKNILNLGRSFAGKVVVLAIAMILMVTAFSAANIQNPESITTLKKQGRSITWDVTMNFINPGGQNDYTVFGEAPDANDGPPADIYDVAKPPAPMPPYIRAYLKDNLPTPYTNLWRDYRQYPDSAKVWNLSVKWEPEDEESPTTITMSWSTAEVDESEYTSVNLCTNAGVILQNMLVNNTYTFTCPALVPQNFKIICSVSYPPVVTDIPDQTIAEGSSFATIALDNYVSDADNTDAQMTWTYSGNSQLSVSIVARVATITIPNLDWNGAEMITFRATDPGLLWDDDAATFTVTAVNDPPVVTDIPSQTIAEGSSFATIALDNYV
ncbi:MAG: hypothetical protein IMZ53_06475, partial [Thermoplasmata archaeon]|nr:hypothetical protein [Thermoplasmata archaeon]